MKVVRWSALIVVLASVCASAQLAKIVIPAGTPEDKALQAITNETDAQKRIAMLNDFVQQFASNKDAVAYGNWQIAQAYHAAGDLAQALAYGDKALAVMPDNLDILVSQAGIAQQAKDNAKVMDYAARAGVVLLALDKQTKPEGMSDEDWANRRAFEKSQVQPSAEFVEAAAYNTIGAESDAKTRLQFIERFTQAFPTSKFTEPAMTLALVSLQEMNDMTRLAAFADKALAANPNNVQTLTILANAFAEDPKGTQLAKAGAYARKAIELLKAEEAGGDGTRRITAGFAHSVLGYVLLRQEKTPAGIAELKIGADMLRDDPTKLSIALYRLGYAYAKLKNYEDARVTLTRATTVPGPFREEAKKLLDQVNAASRRRTP